MPGLSLINKLGILVVIFLHKSENIRNRKIILNAAVWKMIAAVIWLWIVRSCGWVLSVVQIKASRNCVIQANVTVKLYLNMKTRYRLNVLFLFVIHLQVSYIAFILLYAYVITMFFPRFDSSQTLGGLSVVEVILYFWIATIIMEEIRQVGN